MCVGGGVIDSTSNACSKTYEPSGAPFASNVVIRRVFSFTIRCGRDADRNLVLDEALSASDSRASSRRLILHDPDFADSFDAICLGVLETRSLWVTDCSNTES